VAEGRDDAGLVMCTGYPWVNLSIPAPIPVGTHTRSHGYGFLMGLQNRTRTHTHRNPYPQPWVWVSSGSARIVPMGLLGKTRGGYISVESTYCFLKCVYHVHNFRFYFAPLVFYLSTVT
jgi:hypothetical protein